MCETLAFVDPTLALAGAGCGTLRVVSGANDRARAAGVLRGARRRVAQGCIAGGALVDASARTLGVPLDGDSSTMSERMRPAFRLRAGSERTETLPDTCGLLGNSISRTSFFAGTPTGSFTRWLSFPGATPHTAIGTSTRARRPLPVSR